MADKTRNLTDLEWNAISNLTSETHLDQSFDVYQTKGGKDCFYDYEEDHPISLKDGLELLYEAMAYPLAEENLTKEEANAVVDLFREFKIGDEETYKWLLKDEPEKNRDKGER
jgi:hypothetical protein